MIVRMKKTVLLCMASRRDEALETLRELGVLHVSDRALQPGQELEDVRRRAEDARHAVELLRSYVPNPAVTGAVGVGDGEAVIEEARRRAAQLGEAVQALEKLEAELGRLRPLGDFDLSSIGKLESRGIGVRVFTAPVGALGAAPAGSVRTILACEERTVWFALTGPADTLDTAPPFDEVTLPTRSPAEVRRLADEKRCEIQGLHASLGALARRLDQAEQGAADAAEAAQLVEVREGMTTAGPVCALTGFCPVPAVQVLRRAAGEHGWGLLLSDPDPAEPVPTLIRYPRLARPAKAVFDFLEIRPGYREADISAVFLLFFSLFFAMLIGDAGYGALFLGATLFARRKLPRASREPFILFAVLSSGTILWGILTGNYFGIAVESLPAPLRALRIDWLTDTNGVIGLCFVVGGVHLTIAHAWNAILRYPDRDFVTQIGRTALVWAMCLGALKMVAQSPADLWPAAGGLFAVGIVLVILFMTPPSRLKTDWIRHVMLPLDVVSCFVDVVSYVRLFAVGLATLKVAASFNAMALDAGFGDVFSGLLAAVVLALGHGLNVALCALAVLVHGVRLNTLEFSTHKELQWSGFPYDPFRGRKRVQNGDQS